MKTDHRKGGDEPMKTRLLSATALAVLLLAGPAFATSKSAEEIQAPRSQEVQAPRGQDVQAPRGEDVQSP
jgi:hypothetical protein